jgi:hypothetical protein
MWPQVLEGLRFGAVDGTDMSMALWAAAVLRRPPSAEWMAAWWRVAADPRVAATFDATSIAQSLWAAAQLRTLLDPFDDAWLYGTDGGGGAADSIGGEPGSDGTAVGQPPSAAAIMALLAQMSSLMRSASTANLSTTIAALADLQYRYGTVVFGARRVASALYRPKRGGDRGEGGIPMR